MGRFKKGIRRTIAAVTALALTVTSFSFVAGKKAEAAVSAPTYNFTVDMKDEQGEILHGASGFLYGVSSEDVPTTNTLVPLKPKVLATKGALGTEHPYGDALDVAKTFLESGGEQIMMYNSNYYGVFGVMADYKDYSKVLKDIIAPHIYKWKQEWKKEHGTPEHPKDNIGAQVDIDKAIIYIPVNEGTPNVGAAHFGVAWKSYYDAIHAGDPDATIAGTNDWAYNSAFGTYTDENGNTQSYNLDNFIPYCIENNCMPDIFTWHELDQGTLVTMADHKEDFVQKWNRAWKNAGKEVPELPQICINEYAQSGDCGVPGRLVNWIARLEGIGAYGCLPFWHQANNLNDLTTDPNEPNGAWWAFKWYGDMSGQRLGVKADSDYDKLYGLATIDDNKQSAKVLLGGQDGNISVVLKQVDKTKPFANAKKVRVKVESTTNVGLVGTQSEAPVIIDGVYPVNNDGSVSINLMNAKFSTAYCVTLTKADEEDVVEDPVVYKYQNSYEAEQGKLAGGSIKTGSYTSEAQFWGPDSFISDNDSVLMKKGAELTYTISVPVDGKYELNFIYGNGTGTKRREPENSLSLNLRQSLSIDGGAESVITMRNTLLTNTTGSNKQYVDLKAGTHTVKLKSLDSGEILHDLLIVTHDGAYNRERRLMDKLFEAEQADFNTLMKNDTTTVSTKSTYAGYSGAGYVDGLTKSVTDGGGIRWNVVVDDSGLYNFTLRYRSESAGNANIYIGNTATTLDKKVLTLPVENTQGEWKTVTATAYLQKGINIVDADASVDICLDYMRVKEPQRTDEIKNYSTLIEAEDCIPAGAEKQITVGESAGASGGKYVKKINGDAKAKETLGRYLEFTYNAPEDGSYEMQVFQSNDEICGTHGYNTKVIDKYMSFEVKDSNGNVLSDNRYFFMNTNSQDSFKEKTISLTFKKGENKIRVYNDDSWEVLYGGSQTEPGENRLVNTMPNVDKFIITPTKLAAPARQEVQYAVNVRTTGGGYASADKNTVREGESFSVTIAPDSGIERVLVNGADYTSSVSDNRLEVHNVTGDAEVRIYFSDIEREYRDLYIKNAGFGVGTTLYWNAKDVIINKNALNSYEGYYASLAKGSELSQTIQGIPAGTYNFSVYGKGSDGVKGKVKFKVTTPDGTSEKYMKLDNSYMCNTVTAKVNDLQDVTVSIDTSGLTDGNVYLDNFSVMDVSKRDTSKVSEDVLYFVDAGDYYPDTLPDGEKFGIRSSSTEQIYSQDPVTGYYWGVLPSEQDPQVPRPIFSSGNAVYTKYMYPPRWDMADKKDKNGSYRQTYEQDNFATKYIRYAFELEPGEYVLTVGFQAMWGDRGERKIIANKKQLDSYTIPQNNEYGMAVRTFTIEENENKLELSIEKASGNIWVNYLVIEKKTSGADTGALKTLCDSMNKITNAKDDPYTNATWSTFAAALSAAKAYLEPEFIPKSRQSAVNDAVKKLQSAYDGLIKQSDEILNPYDKVEAEYYSKINGPGTENCGDEGGTMNIAYTANGHWLKYSNLDFTKGATKFLARIASNSSESEPDPELELRLDSLDGEVIGTMKAQKNGEWQKYITVSCDVKNVDGMHDVYMVFKGPFNFNWFMFKGQDINPYERYEAEDFSDKNGVNTENCGDEGGTKNVCWVAVGHWVKYESVGFTKGSKKFLARIACNSGEAEPDPELELRLDSVDGELIGTMKSAKNGEWQKYITVECDVKDVRGTHDVYMIFKGPFNFNWWKFVQTDEDLPTEQPSQTEEPSATEKPSPTEQPVPTDQPSTSGQPAPTEEPSSPTPAASFDKPGQSAPPQNTASPTPSQDADNSVKPEQGKVYKIGDYKYKITNLSKKTASVAGVNNKKTNSIKVPDSVKIQSVRFRVTAVGNNAFKGCKKAKKVQIGKNVAKIGKRAFYKCSGLKTIVIKSKKLKSAGAGCFKGVNKKAVVRAPKKYLATYKKLIRK